MGGEAMINSSNLPQYKTVFYNFQQWFAGNDYEFSRGQKILSLCLFHFSMDNSRLTVFYFGRFYIDRREARERFINDVIPHLLQNCKIF